MTAKRLDDLTPQPRPRTTAIAADEAEAVGLSTTFHRKAGTLTPGVSATLAKLGTGAPAVRISHQPNFGAYLKLFGLFAAADAVAERSGSPTVYIVNDCDVVGNERFRRCALPDATRPNGCDYIALPRMGTPNDTVSSSSAPPPSQWLPTAIAKLSVNLERESRLTRIGPEDGALEVDALSDHLAFALEAAGSLSEFTSIVLSRLVNIHLGLDVAFLSGRQLWKGIGAEILPDLLGRWPEVVAAQREAAERLGRIPGLSFNWNWLLDDELAPVWWVCDCNRRVRLSLLGDALAGDCAGCGARVELPANETVAAVAHGRLLPRVGLLDLTEGASANLGRGVTYISSAAHTLIYGLIGERLGISPLEQIFLDPVGAFGSPVERLLNSTWRPKSAVGTAPAAELVRNGRASCFYYLTRLNRDALIGGIGRWVTSQPFDEPIRL